MKMDVRYSKRFVKQFKKADSKIQEAFEKRQKLFLKDPSHITLHNHLLRGSYKGMRSINVTGDWRALYSEQIVHHGHAVRGVLITFEALGTHSQLYKA